MAKFHVTNYKITEEKQPLSEAQKEAIIRISPDEKEKIENQKIDVIVVELDLVEHEHNNHIQKIFEISKQNENERKDLIKKLDDKFKNAKENDEEIDLSFDRDRRNLYIDMEKDVSISVMAHKKFEN